MTRAALLLCLIATVSCGQQSDRDAADVDSRLRALRSRLDALHLELAGRAAADSAISAAPLATGDAIIAIDSNFLIASVTQASRCYLDRIGLDLSDKVSVHREGKISVGVLFGRIPAGNWTVDVEFPRLQGILRAGDPEIVVNGDHLDVTIPVRIAEGNGAATVEVGWDPTAVSGLVCDSFTRKLEAAGEVVPRDVILTGRLVVDSDGRGPVVRSEVDDDHFRLHVTLSDQSYQGVRAAVRKQSEVGRCNMVLDETKVETRVREFVDRGFRVRLPRQIERAFRLPTRFASEVRVLGRALEVNVEAGRPTLDDRALWSSARVTMGVGVPAAVAGEADASPSPPGSPPAADVPAPVDRTP